MPRMELLDIKDRENAICKRCGETRSVKYKIGGKTYCNRCAPLIVYNNENNEEYDDDISNLGHYNY